MAREGGMTLLVVVWTDAKVEEVRNQGTGYAWGQVTATDK